MLTNRCYGNPSCLSIQIHDGNGIRHNKTLLPWRVLLLSLLFVSNNTEEIRIFSCDCLALLRGTKHWSAKEPTAKVRKNPFDNKETDGQVPPALARVAFSPRTPGGGGGSCCFQNFSV